MSKDTEQQQPRESRPGRFWVILLLTLAFAGLAIGLIGMAIRKPGNEFERVLGVSDQQRIFGGVKQLNARLGESDAPVQVQIFTDVQCIECKDQFLETVPPLVSNEVRDGEVQLLYRNRSLTRNPTELGFYGVEAAGEQGYAWQYAYLLFRNQEEAKVVGLDQEFLTKLAESITHLDVIEWTKAYEDGLEDGSEMTTVLEDQDKLAFDLEIRAEPAAVVSGPNGTEIVQDSPDLEEIQQAIDSVR